MSERYKIRDQNEIYFMTITIVDWIDLFTRKRYVDIITDSLNYCILEKGLIVYAYVIMPSHLHLVASTMDEDLNDIIRDFKKITSKEIIKAVNEVGESRVAWLLDKFAFHAKRLKRTSNYKVWKDGFHPKIMDRTKKLEAAINYVHYNPVEAGYVRHEWEWVNSSASFYADGMLCNVEITSWY
jgi:REP element-mobilizing transposase RayT